MRPDRDAWSMLAWTLSALLDIGAGYIHLVGRLEPASPDLLWLLALPVLLAALQLMRVRRRSAGTRLSTLPDLMNGPVGYRTLLIGLPTALSIAGCGMLVLALARPQSRDSWQDVKREGIDIVMALDVSASMLAKDLRPDRLEASKKVGAEFIEGRPDDRIGLVVYEGEAFTQCPLTTDHEVLKELLAGSRPGLLEGGTAVGMGLATALNRLRESESKSKVVILLTDGVNNAGTLQPIDAAQIAQQLGIRVYTIGVGSRGKALSPVSRYPNGQYRYDYVEVEIDDAMLTQVAEMTGGRYFRATNERKLQEIYREIDRMEKTRVKVTEYSQRNEEFHAFAWLGALALLSGFLLDRTLLRTMA